MPGLSGTLHSWQASRFHTQQESCLNKPPAVEAPSTPLFTSGNRHSAEECEEVMDPIGGAILDQTALK